VTSVTGVVRAVKQKFRTSSLDSLPDSEFWVKGAVVFAFEAWAVTALVLDLTDGFWSFTLTGFVASSILGFSAVLIVENSQVHEQG
jgi:hypothetical protein